MGCTRISRAIVLAASTCSMHPGPESDAGLLGASLHSNLAPYHRDGVAAMWHGRCFLHDTPDL